MKIRNGFVSNSSSSSFIIAIGKIIDRQKADEFIKMHDKDEILFIKTLKEIKENTESFPDVKVNSRSIYVDSFDWTTAEINLDSLNDNDEIIYASVYANIEEDEDGDCEYNDDDYSDDVHKALSIFDDPSIVESSDIMCGAGRNG